MSGLVAALALTAASAQDPRGHVDQARFFVRRGWFDDARTELERAVATEDGALDGSAWYLLSEVRYRLGDIEGAALAADRAHSNAKSDEELELAAGFASWLRANFGTAELTARFDGVRSTLEIELQTLILDPDLKHYLNDLGARFEVARGLPVRFGLPAGTYRINGRELAVAPGAEVRVRVPVRGAPPEPLQVTEVEASFGVHAWFGGVAREMLPSPQLRVGVTQPIGAGVLGLAADWTPGPYLTPAGGGVAVGGGALALRGGVEAARIRDAALRAELSLRAGRVGGLALPCARDGQDWTCGRASGGDRWVVPGALVLLPGVELSAVAVDRRRTTALGWGVRVIGEAGPGRRPATAGGRMGDEGAQTIVADEDRAIVLAGVRVLGTVVWAR